MKRLESSLGKTSVNLGSFVVGGFAFSLLHRHDIRVAIASGMHLKQHVTDAARRLEMLAILYPCYWRWSTTMLVRTMVERMGELARSDDARRADILEKALGEMENHMDDYQVVGFRQERRVDLVRRSEAKRLKGDVFRYHPFSNPASRRTGAQEIRILLADLRSGSLWRACQALALAWQTDLTYRKSAEVLATHSIALWRGTGAVYGRTRWTFFAEPSLHTPL